MLDDFPASLIRFMPTVQRMQARGTTLVNFIVASPLCCPARVSWLRGRYPHAHGVLSNAPPLGGWPAFHANGGESDTFAVDLSAGRYVTGAVGKYVNGYVPTFVPPGWSWWRGTDGGYQGFHYFVSVKGRRTVAPPRYFSDAVGAMGRRFLTRRAGRERPFYLQVNLLNPHSPYRPAPRDAELFPGLRAPRTPNFGRLPRHAPRWMVQMARRRQPDPAEMDRVYRLSAQSVQSADRVLADLIKAARQGGVLDDTVFVLTADQGARVGEHGLGTGKSTAGDEVVRVPLIAMGPGIQQGARVSSLASAVDWRATVSDLAGLPAPKTDGVSLVPLLRGKVPQDWRRTVLIEHQGGRLLPDDPDYEPKAGQIPTFWAAWVRNAGPASLRQPRGYAYVVAADGSRELYVDDRWQRINRAGELTPRMKRRMDRAVMQLAGCSGSACTQIGNRMPTEPLQTANDQSRVSISLAEHRHVGAG